MGLFAKIQKSFSSPKQKGVNSQGVSQSIPVLEDLIENNLQRIIKEITHFVEGESVLFRGENRKFEELTTPLYRSMPKDTFEGFEQQILAKAGERFDEHLTEAAILTQLQHHGGKTNLVPFSKNLFVALFFACYGEMERDGRILVTKESRIGFASHGEIYSGSNETRNQCVSFEKEDERSRLNSTVFIHVPRGYLEQEEYHEFIIDSELKTGILNSLSLYYDINVDTLFSDLAGFAQNSKNFSPETILLGREFDSKTLRTQVTSSSPQISEIPEVVEPQKSEEPLEPAESISEKAVEAVVESQKSEEDLDIAESIFEKTVEAVAESQESEEDLEITSENITSENITSENITSENITSENMTSENIVSEKAVSDVVESQKLEEDLDVAASISAEETPDTEIDSDGVHFYRQPEKTFSTELALQLLEWGDIAYHRQDFAEAQSRYQQAAAVDPKLLLVLVRLGSLYGKLGDIERSLATLNKALSADNQLAEGFFTRGILRFEQGEYSKSLSDLFRASNLGLQSPETYCYRGRIYLLQDEMVHAMEEFSYALKSDKNFAEAYLYQGEAKMLCADSLGAIKDFSRAIELSPRLLPAHIARAKSYFQMERYEESLVGFSTVMGMGLQNAEILDYRGQCGQRTGNIVDAMNDFSQAIFEDSEYAPAYFHRGELKRHFGDKQGANEDFTKAISFDKQRGEYYQRRGEIWYEMGDLESTVHDIEAAFSLGFFSSANYLVLARIYEQRGDLITALTYSNDAVAQGGEKEAEAYYFRGNLRSYLGDEILAFEDYAKVFTLNPYFAPVHNRMGTFFKKQGDLNAALRAFEISLSINSNRGVTYFERAEILSELKDNKRAISDYQLAIELSSSEDVFLPVALLHLGELFLEIGESLQAISNFNKVLTLDGRNVRAYLGRAKARIALEKNLTWAVADLDEAIFLDPAEPELYSLRGYVRGKRGDFCGAMGDHFEAIRLNEECSEFYYRRSLTRWDFGGYREALEDCDQAIFFGRGEPKYFEQRAKIACKLGHFTNALGDHAEAIRLDENRAESYYLRGVTKVAFGNYQSALVDCDKAISLEQSCDDFYSLRAVCLREVGQFTAALGDHFEAIRLNENRAESYYFRGATKVAFGNYHSALLDYDKAIFLDPTRDDFYSLRALCLREMGQFTAALSDHFEAISLNPKSSQAYLLRSQTKIEFKDYEGALKDCDEAILLAPNRGDGHYVRGNINHLLENNEEALRDYDTAISLKEFRAYNNRGNVKLSLNRREDALKDYTEAITKSGKECILKAYHNRGVFYLTRMEYSKALDNFNAALEINTRYLRGYKSRAILYQLWGKKREEEEDRRRAQELSPA